MDRDVDSMVLRRLLAAWKPSNVWSWCSARIYAVIGPTDIRKGFEGFFGLVKERLRCSPFSGHLFLFANARRNRLEMLYWDRMGTAKGSGGEQRAAYQPHSEVRPKHVSPLDGARQLNRRLHLSHQQTSC